MWSRTTDRAERGDLRLAALALPLFLLTACSPHQTESASQTVITEAPEPSAPRPPGSPPAFDGPWAADFGKAYGLATSAFERAVLSDGKITDQEFIEMRDKFTGCLTALGYTKIDYRNDGTFDVTGPDRIDVGSDAATDEIHRCALDSGEATIGALHSWVRRNPDNQDEDTIMAACLVREGVVERGYSANDYAKDYADDTFPFLTGTPGEAALRTCNNDPLALHR